MPTDIGHLKHICLHENIERNSQVSTAVSAVGFLICTALVFRMLVAVNKRLPPEKRIPRIEDRYHIAEIKRLYADLFPDNSVPAVWFLLQIASPSAVAIGTVPGLADRLPPGPIADHDLARVSLV